jgi:hypothetical protein
MIGMKISDDCRVFLRACEGLPVLVLVIVCLAISWHLRKDPVF